MILRVLLKNFLSFDDEVQFDMFPNMKRTSLSQHIYTDMCPVPILKQMVIYGPNGAGKSNLVKALEFIKMFAIDRDFLKRIELTRFFYLLKENPTASPLCISIEFTKGGRTFFYEIEIGVKSVERESLIETFPTQNRTELVFERKGKELRYADSVNVGEDIRDATKRMLAKNPLSSVLSLNREFPILQDNRAGIAYGWFNSQLEIIGIHSFLPMLIDLLREDKQMMEFAQKLIYSLEVGVLNFGLEEIDFDQWAKSHTELVKTIPNEFDKVKTLSLNANNKPVLSISLEDGIRKVYQLIFKNIGKDGFIGRLDTSSQSDGTIRALVLLPALYYASKKGKTVVVDEINFCLSPTMVKGIVSFFAKTVKTNGQLIFTTHDTQLLEEKDVLRSDEIWFVDKREGASFMYSHNDFKEHHTISPFRGYNEGRYGAIRFVDLLRGENE